MKQLSLILLTSFITIATGPFATAASKARGISFDAAVGYPTTTIKNPNSTEAYYSGVSLQGRILAPLFESAIDMALVGSLRYSDLVNNANSGNQKEVGNLIGPGAGLAISTDRLILGVDYYYYLGRHYGIGTFPGEVNYKMPALNIYGGFQIQLGNSSISLTYSMTNGTISKDDTKLSKNAEFTDNTVWLHLIYHTGAPIGKFLVDLLN